jgi:Tfp pilus assembly protein PilX
MTSNSNTPTGRRAALKRRGSALYVAVTATTMIVSVLGLTALSVVRLERKQSTAINDRLIARSHARSAVELALRSINDKATWRTTYVSGVESPAQSLGAGSTGTVSWLLADSDGSLANADALLRLKGIGRVGGTVQVSSVEVRAGEVLTQLRKYEVNDLFGNPVDIDHDDLKSDAWWGQYFKPNLPADANGWRVASVDVAISRQNWGRSYRARLYAAGGGNLPAGTVVDSVDLASSGAPSSRAWYTISFSGTSWLQASEGIYLALETNEGQAPVRVYYDKDGVSAANSAMLRGNPGWYSYDPQAALQYRVRGYYTTSSDVHAVAGTWQWDAP